MSQSLYTQTVTGSGAISSNIDLGGVATIKQITYHADGAATTSENFTVTINSAAGAAYDTVVYSVDVSGETDTQNIIWKPSPHVVLANGDTIDLAFANTETNTIGITVYYTPSI